VVVAIRRSFARLPLTSSGILEGHEAALYPLHSPPGVSSVIAAAAEITAVGVPSARRIGFSIPARAKHS
jgi:hypothetical protein